VAAQKWELHRQWFDHGSEGSASLRANEPPITIEALGLRMFILSDKISSNNSGFPYKFITHGKSKTTETTLG